MPAPPIVHGYCTLTDLREQVGDTSNKLSDTLLTRAINAASRAVDNWCDRRFWQDDAVSTRTFSYGTGPDARYNLELPGNAEISTTTGLVVATADGNGSYAGGNWAVGTDFRLAPYDANDPSSRYKGWWLLEGTGNRQFGVRNTIGYWPIQITARFGWSAVPVEVEQATLLKAAALFKRKDAPFGVVQFGDIAAVRVTRADIDVIELLAPYQRDAAMVG